MILVRDAILEDLDNCLRCLENSSLAENYFQDTIALRMAVSEAILKREVYVASVHKATAGIMRIDYEGMMGQFPVMRVISVLSELRNRGIGSALLDYFEKTGFSKSPRLFLCVSDFNERARRLYERRGFREVGKVEGLYGQGITEFIMMKNR